MNNPFAMMGGMPGLAGLMGMGGAGGGMGAGLNTGQLSSMWGGGMGRNMAMGGFSRGGMEQVDYFHQNCNISVVIMHQYQVTE